MLRMLRLMGRWSEALRGQKGCILRVEKSTRGDWDVPVIEVPDAGGSVALEVRTAAGVPIAQVIAHFCPANPEDKDEAHEWADVDVIPDTRWTVRGLVFARQGKLVEAEEQKASRVGVSGPVAIVAADLRRS